MTVAGGIRLRTTAVVGRVQSAGSRSATALTPAREWVAEVGWPIARPVWRAFTRALRIGSALGWSVFAIALASWFASRAFGWQELTVASLIGAAVLIIAAVFVVGRSAYAVTLDLASTRVVVGERAVGRVEVRNSSARALLPATIELPVGAAFAAFRLPRLTPDAVHEDLFTIPTQRRTVLTVGPVRSVRGDALGLLRREVTWTDATELFVHPRTVNLDGSSAGFLRDLEGLPTRDLSSDDVSFHALRQYVSGDDLRHVHWKSTARTGTVMVRQFEETRRSHIAIALSTANADYATSDGFELAVSTCGSLGLQALKEDKALTVLSQRGPVATRSGKLMLDGLSTIEQRDSRQSIVDLARTTASKVPNASVALLIFGGPVSPSQVRSAAANLPLGVRVIAINCEIGASPARRAIGDVVLLTIGELADLPAAMRRVTA